MISELIPRIVRRLRTAPPQSAISYAEPWQAGIVTRVAPYTMTSQERILSTINAVEYVVRNKIEGSIIECGVWKGGNMMAAALTLLHLGAERPLWLFDTFSGMTTPEDRDKDWSGSAAQTTFAKFRRTPEKEQWCEAGIEEVRANLRSTGYPDSLLHYVEGPVESTIPAQPSPAGQIAVLRLDTDWYTSTLHELTHLYPHVTRHGVVIIDDYGHWQGARQAVDEYLESQKIVCLLHRIDYTAREFVKP